MESVVVIFRCFAYNKNVIKQLVFINKNVIN